MVWIRGSISSSLAYPLLTSCRAGREGEKTPSNLTIYFWTPSDSVSPLTEILNLSQERVFSFSSTFASSAAVRLAAGVSLTREGLCRYIWLEERRLVKNDFTSCTTFTMFGKWTDNVFYCLRCIIFIGMVVFLRSHLLEVTDSYPCCKGPISIFLAPSLSRPRAGRILRRL